MIKQQLKTLLLIAAAAVATPAFAEGDAAAGAIKAQTCMGCHGIKGYSNAYPTYRVPRLWGQNPEYIRRALVSYSLNERLHPTMQAQANALSQQDMADVAAFFSEGVDKVEATDDPTVKDGLTGALLGQCAGCHGGNGWPVADGHPVLAGQWKDYLHHALKSYYSGMTGQPYMGHKRLLDGDSSNVIAMGGAMRTAVDTVADYVDTSTDPSNTKTVRELCEKYIHDHMHHSKHSEQAKYVEVCVSRRVEKELGALAQYFSEQDGLKNEKP